MNRLDAAGGVSVEENSVRGAVAFGYHGGPPGGGPALYITGAFGDRRSLLNSTLGVDVRLPWWHAPDFHFHLGIEGGVQLLWARGDMDAIDAVLGPYLRFAYDLSSRLGIFLKWDGLTTFPLGKDRPVGFCMFATLGVAFSFPSRDLNALGVSQFVLLRDQKR